MKRLSLLIMLLLAGCATAPSQVADRWSLQASTTAGAALARQTPDGRDLLRIACRRNPADLYAASDVAGRSSGAVRLRVDDASFPLAPATEEPRLAATGPVPPAFPSALMSASSIALSHDGGTLGPYPAPDPRTAAAFLISCRG